MSGRTKKPAAPRKKANGYKMPAPISTGEVIHDTLMKKKWRVGPSIATGGFGEIYSVCDHESSPKKGSSYPYVMKIEPHENGPLFVEKNFYIRNSNKEDIEKFAKSHKLSSLGMPLYFGHGSHEYKGDKFRYLVLERYGKDLWSIFKECCTFTPATSFQLGIQMLDVLEYIHCRGYVHADIKGANILMGQARGTENQAYLVDFGLAARLNDNEFKPNPKCAHNGTIEYTSRDAHLGVFTKRGDLEILGYNLLHWITGSLPWEKLQHPAAVQGAKEEFMKNCRTVLSKMSPPVPEALIKFFEYINSLKPKDTPDYNKCRQMLESYLKTQGKNRNSKMEFLPNKKGKSTKGKTTIPVDANSTEEEIEEPKKVAKKRIIKQQNGDATKTKATKKAKSPESPSGVDNNENDPLNSIEKKVIKKNAKRKSTEPAVLVKVKKTKLAPKATPPAKKNHVNIAIQTSIEKSVIQRSPKVNRKSPRKVSFESPISQVISDRSVNSSGDIFDDSFVIQEKKVKKKKLIAEKEETVQRVVKKKVTTATKTKGRSWRDAPTILNGRSPS